MKAGFALGGGALRGLAHIGVLKVLKKHQMEVIVMMDFIKKGLALGLGLAVTSKEQAEKMVHELVKKGELSLEESIDIMDQWIRQKKERKVELQRIVREEFKQMMAKLDLATKDDIKKLEQRIQQLEKGDE
ncbi:polyhydroxyalkanoate synthesis regulator phasin [Anoxybacillus vitaminiphilus]|uniref:Polyhydroxyalkanoate synthesis regulator phasin n=2 Tax=Paranoxybacillus vitaminiphilus TaxID=581036 RepID=A0A327YGX5_9BACL|nr:polyhydroxyalkanoate synthesis regulator phasin [Anoxybacillus vitaminiphilus]